MAALTKVRELKLEFPIAPQPLLSVCKYRNYSAVK